MWFLLFCISSDVVVGYMEYNFVLSQACCYLNCYMNFSVVTFVVLFDLNVNNCDVLLIMRNMVPHSHAEC